jgi:putative SOS response-associated peptidase YedK
MCGRFTLRTPAHQLIELFQTTVFPEIVPRYNIAPTQRIITIRASGDEATREAVWMRWGLIPFWAKDESIGSRMINARCETAAEKPAFRQAWQKRRCLIVADGFFEWQAREAGPKQPWLIHMADQTPFAMAGLWECWHRKAATGDSDAEEVVISCTILTTEANADMRPLHDRMPVILLPEDHASWLSDKASAAQRAQLMQPLPSGLLQRFPVSTRVNNPRHELRECVLPLTDAPGA